MADPRDLARQWLAGRLEDFAQYGTWDDREFNDIAAAILDQPGVDIAAAILDQPGVDVAAAILDQPGVDVDVEYSTTGASGAYLTFREDATHRNVVIRLPVEVVRG